MIKFHCDIWIEYEKCMYVSINKPTISYEIVEIVSVALRKYCKVLVIIEKIRQKQSRALCDTSVHTAYAEAPHLLLHTRDILCPAGLYHPRKVFLA